jgi:lycopene beta-cyclase
MDPETPTTNGLVQDFLGQRVRSQTPIFDPMTATLMDFDVLQDQGVNFCYVLPFSEREALVESTCLTRRRLSAESYRSRIAVYLDKRFGVRDFDVLAEESGCIPMGLNAQSEMDGYSRIVRTGTSAGLFKTSSGYGFHAIQRHADALARAWAGDRWDPVASPRTRVSRLLDTLFSDFLLDDPGKAPAVFFRLFECVAPDRLARFLSDAAKFRDYIDVIRAVPAGSMLHQLAKRTIKGKRPYHRE